MAIKLKPLLGEIGAQLTIKHCPTFLLRELQALFTFRNPQYEQVLRFSPWGTISAKIPEYVHLSEVAGTNITFPRGLDPERQLGVKSQRMYQRVRWNDVRQESPTKFPQLLVAHNREQRFLFKHFLKDFQDSQRYGNFLYVAPTSAGKTILLLSLAKYLGQKTLVLYNTDQIKKSWYRGIELAFGLAPTDIGIIQREKWVIGDVITIASIQTIAKRKHRWPELFEEIGTLIVDESDLVSAPSYWNFIFSCPAKYVLGATATDYRDRGKNYFLPACFGPIRARVYASVRDTETSMAVQECLRIPTSFVYEHPQGMIDWHEITEEMSDDGERNRLIIHHTISQLRKKLPVLLVSKRVGHVQRLHQMLIDRGIAANMLTGKTNVDRVYSEKLVASIMDGKCKCVVATVQAVKRGANLNPLAVLILAMPVANKVDLEQLIGRIRRRWKGKKVCKLIYILDSNTPYLLGLWKRIAFPTFRKLKVPGFVNTYIA